MPSFKVGDVVEIREKVTDEMVRKFAEVSGDKNPIHLDEEYAKKTRFGRRIAHGMISGALISRALAMDLGPGGVYLGQTMKFMNPIYIDENIVITLTVTAMRDKGITFVDTIVTKENGEVAVKGQATILTPEFV